MSRAYRTFGRAGGMLLLAFAVFSSGGSALIFNLSLQGSKITKINR